MTDKTLSILLIDDDPHTRNMFEMVSSHHHVELATVNDAETALDYLRANKPNVIVMDIMLPGIDGYQALNQIRKQTLAPDVSIVATTAYYTADTQSEILAKGFSGYLPKPLNPATLVPYLEAVAFGDK